MSRHPLKHAWLAVERAFEPLASLATRLAGSTLSVLAVLLFTLAWASHGLWNGPCRSCTSGSAPPARC